MVAVDLWETETSAFWQKEAGADQHPFKQKYSSYQHVLLLKKKELFQTQARWMQYRWQAIKPKGESKADLEIIHELALRIKRAL